MVSSHEHSDIHLSNVVGYNFHDWQMFTLFMLLAKFQQSKLYYCLCHKFTAKLPVISSTTIGCWCTYFANVTLAFNVNGFVPVCCMRNSNDSLYCYYYTISPSRNEKKNTCKKAIPYLFSLPAFSDL